MAKLVEIHPQNPQQRLIDQVVRELNSGAVIVYPTDSGYALGTALCSFHACKTSNKNA